MSERVTYKRLLRQFAAIGPYLREDLCEEGRYRFDCLSVCVSAKPAPDKREFWGWWLVLEQDDHHFRYHYQLGFYNADGEWLDKPIPKKHQVEVEPDPQPFLQAHQRQTDGTGVPVSAS